MTDALSWLVALVGGVALGLVYFGGLWVTVQRLPSARRPGLVAFASFAIRVAAAVAGFAFLLGGDARRAVVALVGFLAVRTVLVRRTRGSLAAAGGR